MDEDERNSLVLFEAMRKGYEFFADAQNDKRGIKVNIEGLISRY